MKMKYQKVLDDIKKIYYFNNILYLKQYNILFSNILKIKNFNILNYKFIRKKFIINNFIYIKIDMKKNYSNVDCNINSNKYISNKYNKYSSDNINIGVYDNNNYRYFKYNFIYNYNLFINNKLNYIIQIIYKDTSGNFFTDFYLTKSLHYYNLIKIFYKHYNKNYKIFNEIKNVYYYNYEENPIYENNVFYRDYKNRRRNNNHKNLDIDLLIKDKINLKKNLCHNTYINFYNDYIYCNIFKNNCKITVKSFHIKKHINKYVNNSYWFYSSILYLFYVGFKYKKFKIYLNIINDCLKYYKLVYYKKYMKNKNKIKFNLNNKLIKILI